MESTGTVSLAPDFFRKELQAYSDWGMAFWRELFQNSVDAGARCISISLRQDGDLARIGFLDDGPGMPLSVLRDVYFRLGATTKTSGQIGGFGRARIVTCFAHEAYAIESFDYRADGAGSEYRISVGGQARRGCYVEVAVCLKDADWMRAKLLSYLASCQLSQSVMIDGEAFKGWCYRQRKAATLSFGDVHINRSRSDHEILVRVNGAVMFTRYTPLKARVIIEIDPENSRKILTSNRDGLQAGYQGDLDRFMEKLSADCQSSLQERFSPIRTDYGNPKRSIARVKPASANLAPTDSMIPVVCEGERGLAAYGQFNEGACLFQAQPSMGNPEENIDYVVYIDSGKPTIRRMASRYSPESLRGTTQERLLHGWSAACEIALSYVLEHTGQDGIDYSTGFLFSDENQAVCMSDSNTHALLLNPLDKRGRMKYKIGAAMLPSQLLALALHEAVHSKESYHNEVFAGLLTDITSLVKPGDYRQIKRALRKK